MKARLLFDSIESPSELEFPEGAFRIGRHPDNAVLDDPSVSSHHCVIQRNGWILSITDLDSTNGTRIDHQLISNAQLTDAQTLHDGTVSRKNHPETAAVWECTQCQSMLCWSCVRRLRVVRRRPITFCAGCDARCRPAAQSMKPRSRVLPMDYCPIEETDANQIGFYVVDHYPYSPSGKNVSNWRQYGLVAFMAFKLHSSAHRSNPHRPVLGVRKHNLNHFVQCL